MRLKQLNLFDSGGTQNAIRRYQEINRKPKTKKPKSLEDRCSRAICDGEICFGEAIDWLIERGMSEDDAFNWAMNRFAPVPKITNTSPGTEPVKLVKRRSKLRKAA